MRQTTIKINYEGRDISQDISPYLLSFTFNDNSGDTADDLNISLMDRGGLWLNSWTPSKGDKITASIEQENFSLPCGVFEVDQIEYSAPPHVMSIKAVSSGVKSKAAKEKHTRAWENVNLSRIAKDLAGENGLGLYFDAENDFHFERKEQALQPDLEFLKQLCADYGLSVKVNDGKIIIFDTEKASEKNAVSEINSGDKKIISWKFSSKSAGVYSKAKVKYHNAKKGEEFISEATDDSVEGSEKVLELNERAESLTDAVAKAKKKLQAANAKEITGSINLMGDIRFLAGVNVNLVDFGMFSGKYLLSRVTHSVSRSGYTTELNFQMGSSEKKAVKKKKKAKQSSGGGGMLYYEGDKYYHAE